MKSLRSLLAFGIYPVIIVFVSQQRIHVEGDSIDGLETIIDNSENDDLNKPGDFPDQVDLYNQEELRNQLESCLADNKILNEKLSEKENDELLAAKKLFPKKIHDGFFKQFVRHFIEKMSCLNKQCLEPSDVMYMYLTQGDVETLRRYVSGKGNPADALYVMKNMIQGFQHTEYPSYWNRMLSLFGIDETWFKLMVGFSLVLVVAGVFEMNTSLSWLNQLLIVFVIVFIISIPWNWLQLYQEKLAERHAEMMKENDMPEYCHPGVKLTPWKAFTQFFQKITSVKDDCKEYHKKYMVDPILEVSPIKAVAKTIAVLFFAPAGELGKAVAEFHNEFLGNMPKIIWIPAVASWLFILAVVLLCLYFGCSGNMNIHHVRTSTPQPVNPQPSRQMIEDIVQEHLRRQSYVEYAHQEFPSPSLPPVTLRARGNASLQELEAEPQRGFRRSHDSIDGGIRKSRTPERSPTSQKKTQNINSTDDQYKIVQEVMARLKLDSKTKDNSITPFKEDSFSDDISKNDQTRNKETENPVMDMSPSCVEEETFDVGADEQAQADDKQPLLDSQNVTSIGVNDVYKNDDTNDVGDDDEDDFVVLQSSN